MTEKPKGVMIAGMEMPKSCDFCRFAYFTSYACVCYAAEGAVFCKYIDKRPEGCPLLEVK